MWRRKPNKEELLGPQNYPSGICVKSGDDYWYIKANNKWRFASKRAVDSWGFKYIVEGNPSNLSKHRRMGTLGMRDGTLTFNLKDGKLYVISESRLCHVTSAKVLERLGLKFNDAVVIGEEELNAHKMGEEWQ